VTPVAMIQLWPVTGHKHQLRIHMAKCLGGKSRSSGPCISVPADRHLLAPILGDYNYSSSTIAGSIAEEAGVRMSRIYLHAWKFGFKVS
jgi:23S rRNA-/tRNA-specific pseudouridylate synthase